MRGFRSISVEMDITASDVLNTNCTAFHTNRSGCSKSRWMSSGFGVANRTSDRHAYDLVLIEATLRSGSIPNFGAAARIASAM
jgi:hypothetical protein